MFFEGNGNYQISFKRNRLLYINSGNVILKIRFPWEIKIIF